jgi:Zn-dependent protease with chaperone function
MNFFEHQDKARKQSRWLILAFILAVLAIVTAIDLILLLTLGSSELPAGEWHPLSGPSLQRNMSLLVGGGIGTVAVIGLASLFKTMKLSSGGGQVARELGATLVESDPRDPLRRRLRNVVEEIALASGVPVPEIYVLEQEAGINAFAAGYTPADAAITVTRGTLEDLSRDELQGVIAHEFSHVLNGDMRINIRLMGALFGILLLALIGRRVIMHTHYLGRSKGKNGAAILLIAFGLMAVGYLGLFFGRWIKAAISRQREYLADASAVQFTRDPDGIGGALKKIAVYSNGSHVTVDTEEISHMLFGNGRKMHLFSTHPKLIDRIQRIEPGFKASDLDRLVARMANERIKEAQERAASAAKEKAAGEKPGRGGAGMFDAGNLIDQIGQPQLERILMAAALAASIPDNIRQAAQSSEWAPEVLFYSLLDQQQEIREQQLLLIAQRMGVDSEAQVRALQETGGTPTANRRLPLMELAFPALKRRPPEFISLVLATVEGLVQLDGRIDVFEYLLARVIAQHLWESQNPQRTRASGSSTVSRCLHEITRVLAILATHGQVSDAAAAEAAFRAGLQSLAGSEVLEMPHVTDWIATLDADLPKLDQLSAGEKQRFVSALLTTVTHDGLTLPAELELLRAICSLIHVPLPMLTGNPE